MDTWDDFDIDCDEKYQLYLCSREWSERKELVRERSGGVCERCKRNPMQAVHHLTYIRKYEELLEDLQSICSLCHDFVHGKSDYDPSQMLDTSDATKGVVGFGSVSEVQTGLVDVDEMIGNILPSQLIILGSAPAMGKTSFALHTALSTSHNATVLYVSPSQSASELAARLLTLESGVTLRNIIDGNLSGDDRKLVESAKEKVNSDCKLWVDSGNCHTVAQISTAAKSLKNDAGLDLIVVDYLQLLSPATQSFSRDFQFAEMMRDLKFLAQTLDVVILCLAQLTVSERIDARPRLGDFRESVSISQDADLVLLLHRPDYYDPVDCPGLAEVIVAKNRNGATGIANLDWKASTTTFSKLTSPKSHEGGYFSDEGGF